jgi:hypothetical protein
LKGLFKKTKKVGMIQEKNANFLALLLVDYLGTNMNEIVTNLDKIKSDYYAGP